MPKTYEQMYADMTGTSGGGHTDSPEFTAMAHQFGGLVRQMGEHATPEQASRMIALMEELQRLAVKYVRDKGNERATALGKQRLAMANELISAVDEDRNLMRGVSGAPAPARSLKDVVEEKRAMRPERVRADELAAELRADQKTSLRGSTLSNSPEYNRILHAITKVNQLARGEMSESSVREMGRANRELLAACHDYEAARGGFKWTRSGRDRLAMVRELSTLAERDQQGIDQLREKRVLDEHRAAGHNWRGVTQAARTLSVDVGDRVLTTVGAQMSSRVDLRPLGRDGFFTEDKTAPGHWRGEMERVVAQQPARIQAMLKACPDLYNPAFIPVVANRCKTPEHLTQDIGGGPLHAMITGADDSPIVRDPRALAALHAVLQAGNSAMKDNVGNSLAGIADGANITRRNVATSRMASLLGVDSLIARSETMQLTQEGRTYQGVFMATARGYDINSRGHQEQFGRISVLETRELQRQCSSLEIFDLICGQCDRHGANMLYDLQPGPNGGLAVAGIQGIDNDLAFGTRTDISHKTNQIEDSSYGFPSKFTPLGEVRYVDATLHAQVMAMRKEHLTYALGDVLKPEEIDACWNRTEQIQRHFVRGIHDRTVRVMSAEDWDMVSAADMQSTDSAYKKASDATKNAMEAHRRRHPEFASPRMTLEEPPLAAVPRGPAAAPAPHASAAPLAPAPPGRTMGGSGR